MSVKKNDIILAKQGQLCAVFHIPKNNLLIKVIANLLGLEAYLPDNKESMVEKLESNTSPQGASKASRCGTCVTTPETSRRTSSVSNVGSSLEDLDKRGNRLASLVPELLPCGMSKEKT